MVKTPSQRNAKGSGFSKLIINLATAAVCVSVMVMILAIAIVKGYQHEVRDKLIGFNAPIQISHLDLNNSFESLPISRDTIFEYLTQKKSNITYLQRYATKAGIIKTESAFEGIVLKGVGNDYHFDFLKANLKEGIIPSFQDSATSQQILISAITARKLNFKLGDKLYIYFIQDPPRVRKLEIAGIFDSGMGELDELYAFVDIRQVQKLNNWSDQEISGYEIGLKDFSQTHLVQTEMAQITPYNMGLSSIFDLYPALFDWLGLLDMNVLIILVLMVAVASINMITALLILILERTKMIGLMKALGGEDKQISTIFLWMAAHIIAKGLLWGNLLGIGMALLQDHFSWIKLDQKSYYLNSVPIELGMVDIALVNVGSFIICLLILLIPVRIVSKVQPIKSIQFN
jgi:lipoprotein-releasing system permease protein